MRIEVRNLQLISAVSEEGGLTKAAEKLNLTQSALSHQLRDVEERMGTQLFHRLGKKMVLTPAGERLLRSAHAVRNELDRAWADIRRMLNGESGELRISTGCYTCYHWLPPVLKPFNKRYPSVDVRIVLQATHYPLESMLAGNLDLAVTSNPIPHPRVRYEPLFRDELVVIMNPDHPLAHRKYIEAQDFLNEHLMVYDVKDEDLWVIQEVLKPAGISPKRISKVGLTEAIIELVKAGLGLGVMARWAVLPDLKKGTLIARPLTRKGFHRQWYGAVLNDVPAPTYMSHFVDLLRSIALPTIEPASARFGRTRTRRSTTRKVA